VVTRSGRLAVIGYVILSLAVGYAIFLNRTDIDQVCATVQQQLDRNEATVMRGLTGLKLIRDKPLVAQARNIPGTAYYVGHPIELAAAFRRSSDELATYQVNAC
jgi:hypothetical protein